MLDMRSSEEAEGLKRMMGSLRLELTAEFKGLEGCGRGRDVSCVDDC